MLQQTRALTALVEDPASVPRTHTAAHNYGDSSSSGSDAFY